MFKKFLESKGINTEAFEKKSAEEIAVLYNEYNEKNNEALTALLLESKEANASNAEEIKALKKEINAAKDAQLKSLNARLDSMGLTIKKLTKKESKENRGLLSSVRKGLDENKEALLAMKGDRSASLSFKAVGTMLLSSNVSGGNVPVEQRLEGLDVIATRQTRLMDVVSRGTAESNIISWVSQANKEGAAGGTAEGAIKNKIDFDLVVASEAVKKRTAFIKISEEMINDVSYMEAEIRNELMRELLLDIEAQVFGGDGVGTNLNGIKTVATAFAPGTHAILVDNPNEADVLTIAMEQIQLANMGEATHAFVNPITITTLKLIKRSATDRAYIDRLTMVAGQLSLDGVQLVPTTLVTAGQYLIGNFPMAKVYDKGEISIEIGRDADDFTRNLLTVLAEWRGLCLVKTNVRPAFVTGVFATDITAITKP